MVTFLPGKILGVVAEERTESEKVGSLFPWSWTLPLLIELNSKGKKRGVRSRES